MSELGMQKICICLLKYQLRLPSRSPEMFDRLDENCHQLSDGENNLSQASERLYLTRHLKAHKLDVRFQRQPSSVNIGNILISRLESRLKVIGYPFKAGQSVKYNRQKHMEGPYEF